jgi:hypothetical protein
MEHSQMRALIADLESAFGARMRTNFGAMWNAAVADAT